jgi:hypothetical protein
MLEDPKLSFRHRFGTEMRDEIANLNDDGFSFARLADLIEEQWERL